MISRNARTMKTTPNNPGKPRDEMLDGIERELRHPVAALVAASDLLAERLGPDHPGAGFAWLIRNESIRLHETLRDLEALSLPLPYQAHETDLWPALMEMAERFEQTVRARRVNFSARISHEPLRAWAHGEAVAQAVERLLRAALESLPRGGRLWLEAERIAEGSVVVRVTDDGPTVPSAYLSNYFQPYFNAPGRRPGMSPAVCRRVVEHLGGEIAARGRSEGGLVVELRFPPARETTGSSSFREEGQ